MKKSSPKPILFEWNRYTNTLHQRFSLVDDYPILEVIIILINSYPIVEPVYMNS
jgi:hypothetical protein